MVNISKMLKEFRIKMKNGNSVIGPFMKTSDPAFVEIAGYSGFDFVILDMEHGPLDVEQMQNNIRAAEIAGVLPIIRTSGCDEVTIGKVLDIGAAGIQVPQVTSAKQGEKIVHAAKYYPQGNRGVCRFVRAARYSHMDKYKYFDTANQCLIILQLEGKEALLNIDEILDVCGIDIIFIGPYDLSQSLGVPGDISNNKVIEKMEYIVTKAKERDVIIGTFVDVLDNIKHWKKSGVLYLSYSVDVGIFYDACCNIIKTANELNDE